MNATRATPEGIERATGRGRQAWFGILDEWGAKGRPFREIADWLTGEHGMSFWWAQKLIVEYEQDRGVRPPGVRPDGTFTVGASKTLGATAERIAEAFTDPALRERWLPGIDLTVRQSQPGKRIRLDVADGTRLNVQFFPAGDRTTVAVEHEKLPDAETAERTKAAWRDRLETLRMLLES